MKVSLSVAVLAVCALALCACEKLSERSGNYQGELVPYDELRLGFAVGTTLDLEASFFDAHLLEGTISSSDGTFARSSLRRISKLANDKLGSFTFDGAGFTNYLYSAVVSAGPFAGREALVVISLYREARVEVRVILGAGALYGVFKLKRVSETTAR